MVHARFARFRLATELSKKCGEVQISALIYAMGLEAEHIFQSFKFGDGEVGNNYGTVIAKFDKHFIPKRNVQSRSVVDSIKRYRELVTQLKNLSDISARLQNTVTSV